MNHVCRLDEKAGEYTRLLNNDKVLIARGSKLQKAPYGHVFAGDRIFFKDRRNRIVLDTLVTDVWNIEPGSGETPMVVQRIDRKSCRRLRGSKYIVVMELTEIRKVDDFKITENIFGSTGTWMLAGNLSYK